MELSPAVHDLFEWDRLDTAAAERAAREVEAGLPPGWRLLRVEERAAGGRRRPVAFFDRRGGEFALIPGGTALLGYDPARPPELTSQDREDWERAEYEYGDLEQHLAETMTPLREARLAPFLMETESREMDMEPILRDGRRVGSRTVSITVGQAREWASAEGFRLPTSDEWEHACRAGARSFWWWGNALKFPLPERNGFGLRIAWDTYRSEWCTHPDVYRGGDGGTACHGGLDGLPTALRLASAYFEPAPWTDETEPFAGDCRRVFAL